MPSLDFSYGTYSLVFSKSTLRTFSHVSGLSIAFVSTASIDLWDFCVYFCPLHVQTVKVWGVGINTRNCRKSTQVINFDQTLLSLLLLSDDFIQNSKHFSYFIFSPNSNRFFSRNFYKMRFVTFYCRYYVVKK